MVSIYSTVYRAFLGISALKEYMEEARATMKNDKFVTGGARQPKRTKKTSATLTRYRTNMNITEQATVQEWLQAMQVDDHWYDGGSDALAFQWNFVFGAQPELTSAMTLFMNYMNKALAGRWSESDSNADAHAPEVGD